MRQIAWNEHQPVRFEVDLVHHCGPDTSGQFIHSLQMIDVATGWSERVATLGRSYRVIEDAFRRALARRQCRAPSFYYGLYPSSFRCRFT